MNYLKVYCNLIRKAENRTLVEGYTEKHHTFPISIFGKNKRVVVLTAREHYIAHALLERICIKRYGLNHYRTKKMTYAFWIMCNRNSNQNSYLYEELKIRRNNILKNLYGEKNSFFGKKHTEETKEKMRAKKLSNKTKEKLSEINCKLKCNLISPDGEIFFTENLPKFCREVGICYCGMHRVVSGKRKTHKGWTGVVINKEKEVQL